MVFAAGVKKNLCIIFLPEPRLLHKYGQKPEITAKLKRLPKDDIYLVRGRYPLFKRVMNLQMTTTINVIIREP